MNLDQFEALAHKRRSVRNFLPDPIPEDILNRILKITQWAPSSYNLQPTHFIVVNDPQVKEQLCPACMKQRQVSDAPTVVVFSGDKEVYKNHFEKMIAMEKSIESINENYERMLRSIVPKALNRGPVGLSGLVKKTAVPVLRLSRPVPNLPVSDLRSWLIKQVMLNAMVFMLAASAADLATVPMEGFDESRVKRILCIPKSHIVPLVVPIGYPAKHQLVKSRFELDDVVHYNSW